MNLNKVILDTWQGSIVDEETFTPHSAADAVEIVRRLDGDTHTLAEFEAASGTSLFVGGGPDQFVAYVDDGKTFRMLCANESNASQTCEVVAGGQLGTYPARHCVDLNTVLLAVEYFAETGEARPNATWESTMASG